MPALITPLTEDEQINRPVLTKLVSSLLAQGADGFYIGGATGEGIALPQKEREILAEVTIQTVDKKKPCIVHVASTDFKQAVALAKHAESCGADAISAIPPMFYPFDEDDVYLYYKRLAESVHIPLIIYYNPAAGFRVNAEFAARMFEVENVTGIKWTSSDYYGMNVLKDLTHGEMNVINGPDEMLLMGLAAGADGGIGSTYNFMLPTIKRIYESFRAHDLTDAAAAQTEADRVIRVLLRGKIIPVCKAVLEAQGFDVGDCVFPLKKYTPSQKKEIVDAMRAAGLKI